MIDLEQKLYNEGFQVASMSKRIYAYSIDELLVSMIIFASFYDKYVALAGDFVAIISLTNTMVLYFVFLKIAYHTIFIHMYGRQNGSTDSGY